MSELTDKQTAFIEAYLACFNATEAARRAGYSRESASAIGWENLRKPEIRDAIAQRLKDFKMDADEVVGRLAEIARGSMADFLAPTGRSLSLNLKQAAAAGKLHLIKSYSKGRHGTKIELYSSYDALVKLGETLGLFRTRNVLENPDGSPVLDVDGAIEKALKKIYGSTGDGGTE